MPDSLSTEPTPEPAITCRQCHGLQPAGEYRQRNSGRAGTSSVCRRCERTAAATAHRYPDATGVTLRTYQAIACYHAAWEDELDAERDIHARTR